MMAAVDTVREPLIDHTIAVVLTQPIDVGGVTQGAVSVRSLTGDEWKHVCRTHLTKQKRGIAICQVATGLPREAVLQFAQEDIEAVFRAVADCCDRRGDAVDAITRSV